MNPYKEEIDKKIIEILYKDEGELTFREIEDRLKLHFDKFSYETYSNRLKQLCETFKNNKQTRYVIQPVLQKRDEGRGKNTFYSLTKDARIRCDLKLPILRSEESIEKAYRLLLQYAAFESSPPLTNHNNKKMMDENEYNNFLEKLYLSEKDLQLYGTPGYNRNFYKVTTWIHPQSELKFIRVDYLEGSNKCGKYEYDYKLPGLSIKEFTFGIRSGLVYENLNFTKDEVIQYFKLLENKNLIQKLRSLQLELLSEERYTIVDNSLKDFFQRCWVIHGIVTIYLKFMWEYIRKPTKEEEIWHQDFWGKQRSRQWFANYHKHRREFKKENQMSKKDIQNRLNWGIFGMKNEFESIKKKYNNRIKKYMYLADPLLNSVYPLFLRI